MFKGQGISEMISKTEKLQDYCKENKQKTTIYGKCFVLLEID